MRTEIWRIPELIQLLSVKSISRNLPPKGTAGLDRTFVKGCSLSPVPPASMIVSNLSTAINPRIPTAAFYSDDIFSFIIVNFSSCSKSPHYLLDMLHQNCLQHNAQAIIVLTILNNLVDCCPESGKDGASAATRLAKDWYIYLRTT